MALGHSLIKLYGRYVDEFYGSSRHAHVSVLRIVRIVMQLQKGVRTRTLLEAQNILTYRSQNVEH